MSEKVIKVISMISKELRQPSPNKAKIGLLSRSVRWQAAFDDEDKKAFVELGEWVQKNDVPGSWAVEMAVLEILCEHSGPQHVPFLAASFHLRGKHGDDRRRLALQALATVAARDKDENALKVLEESLSHGKKDAREWAIGFLLDAFHEINAPLPDRVITKLYELMEHDKSADVRVEASRALAAQGLVDADQLESVLKSAKASAKDDH